MDPADSLYPIAVLIDELRNEDVALRLNSVRRLSTIALALGEERTRKELLPFLQENHDDEDEVLLIVSEELGKFVPLVGGPSHAHSLIPPLEALASVDETVVRDTAVASLRTVGESLPKATIEQQFVPMIQRLQAKEWTARVSAAQLYSTAYPQCPASLKTELRTAFSALATDETPMVRRAAAAAFGGLVKVVETEVVLGELLPVFERLTGDEQDSVRLISVEACGPLATALQKKEVVSQNILPVLLKFAGDKSWRVRYNSATQVPALAEVLGADISRDQLLPAFTQLLRDPEAEVRAAAAGRIAALCAILPAESVTAEIVPCCRELAGDASQYVRTALAGVITELAPKLGKEVTTNQLLPIFLELLRDECPEVRLGIIGKLDAVGKVVGVEQLSESLLPAVEGLAGDKHWRVRLAIIGHVPLLAEQLGAEFLQQKLGPQCIKWLQDQVYCIREAATKALEKLAAAFGSDWAKDFLIPDVLKTLADSNYLYRETALTAISALAPHVNSGVLDSSLIPAVVSTAQKDGVPNVRFNAARVMEGLVQLVDARVVETTLKPCLTGMTSDTDADTLVISTADSISTMAGGNVIEIHSKEEWDKQQADASNAAKIVVDFSATWCGPCRMISPEFEKLSTEFTGIVFLKIDVDEVEAVAAACGISAMPTFQVFKDSAKVDELVGASKDRLRTLIEKYA
ncbi:hypothetical protein KSW81_004078 [Nannochloris sp. 'desiccata']|nr:hypothetical protein KSW81_004078 [Chlorella desiccata (nom. nud.)]